MKSFFVSLMLLVVMVHSAYTLKCYACDSEKSPACLSKEDEKFKPDDSMKKDCPGAESCVTIAIEVPCTDGENNSTQSRTMRYCSYPDELIRDVEAPKCPNGPQDPHFAETPRRVAKMCRKDLCNGPTLITEN